MASHNDPKSSSQASWLETMVHKLRRRRHRHHHKRRRRNYVKFIMPTIVILLFVVTAGAILKVFFFDRRGKSKSAKTEATHPATQPREKEPTGLDADTLGSTNPPSAKT